VIFILCDFHLRYELNRAAAIDAEEKADEDFVRSIFSKNGDVKVSLGLEQCSLLGSGSGSWIRIWICNTVFNTGCNCAYNVCQSVLNCFLASVMFGWAIIGRWQCCGSGSGMGKNPSGMNIPDNFSESLENSF
jgi:hypothetical protein